MDKDNKPVMPSTEAIKEQANNIVDEMEKCAPRLSSDIRRLASGIGVLTKHIAKLELIIENNKDGGE